MKQDFSDHASFLKAVVPLREATFLGRDLAYDEASRTLRLTVTRTDASSSTSPGGFLGRRRPVYLKTVLTVRRIGSYTQYLANEMDDVYVLDRAEVGRGGRELVLYFRPGDRAVLDIDRIDGSVEDRGKATAAPRKPAIVNPLLKEDQEAAGGRSLVGRLLGKKGKKNRRGG